ncbi:MAG: class I SAM-dependent methyltransferase [Pseudonocardiaceae bacterium]
MFRTERIFDLEERVPRADPFETVEHCRNYDRDIRTSMIIPMQHMMKLIMPHCTHTTEAVEIGCSGGLLSLRLASLYPAATFLGLENNDQFLAVAQENTIYANLLNYGGRFSSEWARYSRLPLADNSVDLVYSFCSINRWSRPEKAIAEAARVCRPDGTVILYDLARDADEGMISFVLQYAGGNHEEFMGALRSSFNVDEMATILTNCGLNDWVVTREGINLITTSKPIDVSYSVGETGIYEDIFAPV